MCLAELSEQPRARSVASQHIENTMPRPNYGLVLLAVAIIGVGQIIFKYAAQNLSGMAKAGLLDWIIANRFAAWLLVAAMGLYLIGTVAWIQALRTTPLSVAYFFNALAFLIVPLAGFVLFGEQVPRYFVPGAIMIICGIVLVSWA